MGVAMAAIVSSSEGIFLDFPAEVVEGAERTFRFVTRLLLLPGRPAADKKVVNGYKKIPGKGGDY